MTIPPHFLHIYDKPAIGSGFLKRYRAVQYRHKISANGGFDTATCLLGVDRNEGEIIFSNFIGNRVAIYVDNPAAPIWEGIISRVTLTTGALELTRSLDKMANRVAVQYSVGEGGLPDVTSEVTQTDSIALYGSKMITVDMGETYTTDSTMPIARANRKLDDVAFPVVSTVFGRGGQFGVALEMIGFYHTLAWDTFEVSGSDVTDLPEQLLASNTYTYNGDTFYDNTDSSRISATSFDANGSRQLGESTWDMVMRLAESGSGGSRFVTGISEYNPNTGSRIAYFEAANLTTEYAVDAYGDGRIRSIYGGVVDPWDIRPNRVVRVNNILIGAPETEQIGNIAYIKAIDYDAESGVVTLQTDDNLTLEGVMNLQVVTKATNERFGSPRRQSATNNYSITSLTTSGNLSVGGDASIADDLTVVDLLTAGHFQSYSFTLVDDAAASILFSGQVGSHLFISGNTGSTTSGIVFIRTLDDSVTPRVEALWAGTCVVGIGVLTTGAGDGTDGSFNLTTDSATGRIYIKNRTGASRSYKLMLIG